MVSQATINKALAKVWLDQWMADMRADCGRDQEEWGMDPAELLAQLAAEETDYGWHSEFGQGPDAPPLADVIEAAKAKYPEAYSRIPELLEDRWSDGGLPADSIWRS